MTEPETRDVTIHDRVIKVKEPTNTQLMVIGREKVRMDRLTAASESGENAFLRSARAMANVLDILESLVIEEADRQFLEELMISGKLEVDDLRPIVSAFGDKQPVKAAPRVRRGRN